MNNAKQKTLSLLNIHAYIIAMTNAMINTTFNTNNPITVFILSPNK